MSLGSYDDAEHERRERLLDVDPVDQADNPSRHNGSDETDAGTDTDGLLEQFREMQRSDD